MVVFGVQKLTLLAGPFANGFVLGKRTQIRGVLGTLRAFPAHCDGETGGGDGARTRSVLRFSQGICGEIRSCLQLRSQDLVSDWHGLSSVGWNFRFQKHEAYPNSERLSFCILLGGGSRCPCPFPEVTSFPLCLSMDSAIIKSSLVGALKGTYYAGWLGTPDTSRAP
jgi:hypothetical protein